MWVKRTVCGNYGFKIWVKHRVPYNQLKFRIGFKLSPLVKLSYFEFLETLSLTFYLPKFDFKKLRYVPTAGKLTVVILEAKES